MPNFNGTVNIRDTGGTQDRIVLDGDAATATVGGNAANGRASVALGTGAVVHLIDAQSGVAQIGGPGAAGDLRVRDNGLNVVFDFDGSNGQADLGVDGHAGDLRMGDGASNRTVRIQGANANMTLGGGGQAGRLEVSNGAGVAQIYLDATAGEIGIKDWRLAVPDYVFEPDYDLLSLPDLQQFIDANGHLPDVPSAAEVAERGVALVEFSMILLRKIEELTCYMLDQNAQIETLNRRLAEVEASCRR